MKNKPTQVTDRLRNLTIAFISAQAGCASMVIILASIIIGAWLGSLLGQRGLCIMGMVVLSVPISLYVMVWIALRATKIHLNRIYTDDEQN
ncbi:MAG: hypothetical protein KJ043_01530 [Anaerolineae bacterium]|nr:hypothetical protein [Anaerolineae bacterium]